MPVPGGADQFDGLMGPGQLLAWIANATPWLAAGPPVAGRPAQEGGGPDGFRRILQAATRLRATHRPTREERDDYFALCLACHHATVGSFIPTDVDAKIRGVLWNKADAGQAAGRWELTVASHGWALDQVSTRWEASRRGPVSGHDGEWLAVCGGALMTFIRLGDAARAEGVAAAMEAELQREAAVFLEAVAASRQGRGGYEADLRTLRLAWILTHNAGDVDQGLSFGDAVAMAPHLRRFGELAHRDAGRYQGAFTLAKQVYQVVSAEGHRHYPLRALKCLRSSPDLLLPLAPCLEAWGAAVARRLKPDDAAEVAAALATGTKKVSGQLGYPRALFGLTEAFPGGAGALLKRLQGAPRKALEDPELRRLMAVSPVAFATSLAKRVRGALP